MPLQWKFPWKARMQRRAPLELTPFDKLCQDFRRIGQGVTPAQSQFVTTLAQEELLRSQSVLYRIRKRQETAPAMSEARI